MSRLGFVADVHLGNPRRFGGEVECGMNVRCRQALGTLREAARLAVNDQCKVLIVLGDLFDYERPEAQLIAETQRIFASAEADGCETVVLMGNHEQVSSDPGDHALGPLAPHAHIIDGPSYMHRAGFELWFIPFQPGRADDWLPDALRGIATALQGAGRAACPPERRVLALHLGIRDASTPPWLASAPDSIHVEVLVKLCEEHGIRFAFAGNWHSRGWWTHDGPPCIEVIQVGALCPTGWDNPGLEGYGGLAELDAAGTIVTREVPGPRFVKVTSPDEMKKVTAAARKGKHALYVSHVVGPEELPERTADMGTLTEDGLVFAGEVVGDEQVAQAQARTAAAAARSASTLEEALEGFVREMPLDDGVDRRRVHDRAGKFLGL